MEYYQFTKNFEVFKYLEVSQNSNIRLKTLIYINTIDNLNGKMILKHEKKNSELIKISQNFTCNDHKLVC